jgi:hypothetical protein
MGGRCPTERQPEDPKWRAFELVSGEETTVASWSCGRLILSYLATSHVTPSVGFKHRTCSLRACRRGFRVAVRLISTYDWHSKVKSINRSTVPANLLELIKIHFSKNILRGRDSNFFGVTAADVSTGAVRIDLLLGWCGLVLVINLNLVSGKLCWPDF